jgi:hypothetical protein
VFVVTGGRVHLVDGFTDLSAVTRDSRWSVGELIEHQAELMGDRRGRIPPFGIGV